MSKLHRLFTGLGVLIFLVTSLACNAAQRWWTMAPTQTPFVYSVKATPMFIPSPGQPQGWATPPLRPSQRPTLLPSASRLSVVPAQQAVAAGATFSFTIQIDADRAVRGAQVGVQFNPQVLQCADIRRGSFFADWAISQGGATLDFPNPVINNTAGLISDTGFAFQGLCQNLSGGKCNGPSGIGTLLTVTCTAQADGVSALTLLNVAVVDDYAFSHKIQVSVDNGQVQVGMPPTPAP